jgi:hypothetical protein
MDTSKFVRIAVDWLLRSDLGEVIKKIVDEEAFPDYRIPKKTQRPKKTQAMKDRKAVIKRQHERSLSKLR